MRCKAFITFVLRGNKIDIVGLPLRDQCFQQTLCNGYAAAETQVGNIDQEVHLQYEISISTIKVNSYPSAGSSFLHPAVAFVEIPAICFLPDRGVFFSRCHTPKAANYDTKITGNGYLYM